MDDRERSVIIHLTDHKVERLTVGDYAFVYRGKVLLIVERKTLADLASSLRDGRMQNNDKLLEARANGAQIMYIIEGPAYPKLSHRFGRIPFAALQGKIDSLMFKHDLKVIWTKNVEHTAERLMGLKRKLLVIASDGVHGAGVEVLKKKHIRRIEDVHCEMMQKIPRIGRARALEALAGTHITVLLTERHVIEPAIQQKILTVIHGITAPTATLILSNVSFRDIVLGTYIQGSISNVSKGAKKIGTVVENRIRETFAV